MKYNVGIIGVGGIGKFHLDVIKGMDIIEPVAVVDVRGEEAKAVAEKYGTNWYTDYIEMIEREKPDFVSICLPHWLHSKVSIDAAKAGVSALVEKPMAISIKEADQMIEEAMKNSVKLGVVFQHRWKSTSRRMKKFAEDGELGELMRAMLEYNTFRSQSYYESADWRGKWETEGGGVLINQGIHYIDLFQWIIERRPKFLFATLGTFAHRIEVEDLATATLVFEGEIQASIQMSTIDHPTIFRMEFRGDKGLAELSGDVVKLARNEPSIKESSKLKEVWGTPQLTWETFEDKETDGRKLHELVYKDFVEALTEDREPEVSGVEGRKSVEIVNAIIASGFIGAPVKFPLDSDKYDEILRELIRRRYIAKS